MKNDNVEVERIKPEKVNPDLVRNYAMGQTLVELTTKNAILYALSIGASQDPYNLIDLDYTYELSENF